MTEEVKQELVETKPEAPAEILDLSKPVEQVEKIPEQPKEEELKNPAPKFNRATRRRLQKAVHHNVFTKKYKSKKSLEAAWRMFLGEKEYIEFKKIQKQLAKQMKNTQTEQKEQKQELLNLMRKMNLKLTEDKPLIEGIKTNGKV